MFELKREGVLCFSFLYGKEDNVLRKIIYFMGVIIFAFCFLNPSVFAAGKDPLKIHTVNYPLQYFAGRIAGNHATVVFPGPEGEDPAFWMPDIKNISQYQNADLILLNGANYAKWIDKVTLPQMKLVNTSGTFRDRYIKIDDMVTHSHGPGGEHSDSGIAFTTWIDFSQATQQAESVMEALKRKRPEHRDVFQRNYKALEDDLMKMDQEIKRVVQNKADRALLTSHPVYQYFQRRYGLNVVSVHWEPDKIPTQEQWMELQSILKDHPSKWMIWEGEPNPVSVRKLKSIGVGSLVFNPCGNRPEEGEFLSVMQRNVENLKLAFH